jgi:hypothetical protein
MHRVLVLGYGGRLRTVIRALGTAGSKIRRVRYLAYTSDVGEVRISMFDACERPC